VVGTAFITSASGFFPAWVSPEGRRDECCPYHGPLVTFEKLWTHRVLFSRLVGLACGALARCGFVTSFAYNSNDL
jgi:hypothetical protein